MKNLSIPLIYDNLLKTPFLLKCNEWYITTGYSYLKNVKHIDFPVLHWYNYFSHPCNDWLLLGGYMNTIIEEKFTWIFYIQEQKNLNRSRLIDVTIDFAFYFSKNHNNIELNLNTKPNNLDEYDILKSDKNSNQFPDQINP